MTISASSFPALPYNLTSGYGMTEIYLLHDILNDIQPSLGDEYITTVYPGDADSINAWFTTTLDRDLSLQGTLDTIGNTIANLILADEGNGIPLTVDLIANEINNATPSSISFVAKPIVESLARELKNLGAGSNPVPADPLPDGGVKISASWTLSFLSQFNGAFIDPLVLDLSSGGTGVQLTSLADSSAYFDLYNTGFAVHTGWVGSTTGILVNTTDPTNITNLFGSASTDGFAALQAADTNHDGVINSSDSGWSNLYVWEDANGNGTVDAGEVHSLSSLGITSISLESSIVNETVNGNYISEVATFNYSGGGTGQVAEAFFNNSQMDSTYTGSYTLNPETLLLPNLRGYGTTPDLYVAMSQDSTLLGMVQDLASDGIADAATFDAQVLAIIYQWTGVESVDPTSRGTFINAQDLEAMEAIAGTSWYDGVNPGGLHPSETLEAAFGSFVTATKERLLAQGPLAQYLSGVSYDYDTDSLTGTTDFSSLLTAVGDNIPSDSATATQYLASMGQFIVQLASDLGVSASAYDSTLQGYFNTAGYPLTLSSVDNLHYLTPGYNGTGNTVFNLDSAGAIVEGVSGFTNTLNASGDLTQAVISGVQTLEITSNITVDAAELSGFSSITTSGGVAQLYASTAGTYDLAGISTATISMTADSNGGTTLIGNDANNEALEASTSGNDTLTVGNGNNDTLSAGSGTDALTAGSGTGDTLYASSGTSTLVGGNGGDIFYSGTGVDTIEGGTGNDTFLVNSNMASGSSITGGGGSDVLEVSSKNISSVSISGVSTLEINGSVTLTASQFDSFSSITTPFGASGQLYGSTSGTYDLVGLTTASISMEANSNSGTTLIGNDAARESLTASSSGNDTLTVGNGAIDTVSGGSGNDTLTVGNGNDDTVYAGGNGTDTITLGSGSSDTVYAGNGSDTLIAGTGGSAYLFSGSSGSDTYEFGSSFGSDYIYNNYYGGKSSASGSVGFTSGVTDEDLWFQQSGNNLQIDLLGTSDQVTISNWFSSTGNQVASITADGMTLDSQVASLVSAMASFGASNPSFNPTTATSMPTDTTLQSAIAAAWHS
jgi:Haemolysin-type calcium binding protein related domain/RTX calcium-binding nonapeptide repeat (4 copies)